MNLKWKITGQGIETLVKVRNQDCGKIEESRLNIKRGGHKLPRLVFRSADGII